MPRSASRKWSPLSHTKSSTTCCAPETSGANSKHICCTQTNLKRFGNTCIFYDLRTRRSPFSKFSQCHSSPHAVHHFGFVDHSGVFQEQITFCPVAFSFLLRLSIPSWFLCVNEGLLTGFCRVHAMQPWRKECVFFLVCDEENGTQATHQDMCVDSGGEAGDAPLFGTGVATEPETADRDIIVCERAPLQRHGLSKKNRIKFVHTCSSERSLWLTNPVSSQGRVQSGKL